jgi:hypothetical protein
LLTDHPSRRILTLPRTAFVLALWGAPSWAQTPAAFEPGIYTCEKDGHQLRNDRPIPECADREQRILRPDGSLKKFLPPTLTSDERFEREQKERRRREEEGARKDAEKNDRLMMNRFPTEAAHQQTREVALEPVRRAMKNSQSRLEQLAAERKPLMNEAEFYRGKKLPPALKMQIDANDAAVAAQRDAIQTQEAELARINQNFDAQLDRLRKLWKGAPPGSLGPALR